jgi:hypothetical protein
MLYFAYGANLDEDVLRLRCPGARRVGCAVLHDHALIFDGHSRQWGGAVANVVPTWGARVEGVLYELGDSDVAALDRIEGHPLSYARLVTTVIAARQPREAALYCRPLDKFPRGAPPDAYYRVLSTAYERLGFDRAVLAAAAGR